MNNERNELINAASTSFLEVRKLDHYLSAHIFLIRHLPSKKPSRPTASKSHLPEAASLLTARLKPWAPGFQSACSENSEISAENFPEVNQNG